MVLTPMLGVKVQSASGALALVSIRSNRFNASPYSRSWHRPLGLVAGSSFCLQHMKEMIRVSDLWPNSETHV